MASLLSVGIAAVMMRFEVPSVAPHVAVELVTTEFVSVTVTVTVLFPPGVLNVTVLPVKEPLTNEAGAGAGPVVGVGAGVGVLTGVLGAGAGVGALSSPSSASDSGLWAFALALWAFFAWWFLSALWCEPLACTLALLADAVVARAAVCPRTTAAPRPTAAITLRFEVVRDIGLSLPCGARIRSKSCTSIAGAFRCRIATQNG